MFSPSMYSSYGGIAEPTGAYSYLYAMRFIPLGDYNLINYQPHSVGPIVATYDSAPTPQDYNSLYNEWNASWKGYWSNSIIQQSSDLYITNSTLLTTSEYQCFLFYCWNGGANSGSPFSGFVPKAITTDYAGDVFADGIKVGAGGFTLTGATQTPEVFALYSNGIVDGSTISSTFGYNPTEIAVSPSGKYVFVANASSGNIMIYAAPQLSEEGSIDLSYSNSTYNFNIASYLANGGPFSSNALRQYYANGLTVNDITSNHHPRCCSSISCPLY